MYLLSYRVLFVCSCIAIWLYVHVSISHARKNGYADCWETKLSTNQSARPDPWIKLCAGADPARASVVVDFSSDFSIP